jgi:hypothetical protein
MDLSVKMNVQGHQEAYAKMHALMVETKRIGAKSMQDIAARKTKDLAYELYRQTKATEHERDWYLTDLPGQQGWKIKQFHFNKDGKKWMGRDHIMKELKKRAKHRYYLASPWANLAKSLNGKKLPPSRERNKGRIEVKTSAGGLHFLVTIMNLIDYADRIHTAKGITAKALDWINRDMANYLRFKRGEITKEAMMAAKLR